MHLDMRGVLFIDDNLSKCDQQTILKAATQMLQLNQIYVAFGSFTPAAKSNRHKQVASH